MVVSHPSIHQELRLPNKLFSTENMLWVTSKILIVELLMFVRHIPKGTQEIYNEK